MTDVREQQAVGELEQHVGRAEQEGVTLLIQEEVRAASTRLNNVLQEIHGPDENLYPELFGRVRTILNVVLRPAVTIERSEQSTPKQRAMISQKIIDAPEPSVEPHRFRDVSHSHAIAIERASRRSNKRDYYVAVMHQLKLWAYASDEALMAYSKENYDALKLVRQSAQEMLRQDPEHWVPVDLINLHKTFGPPQP